MEVARVEPDPPDDLVDVTELRDGELLSAECRRKRRVLELRSSSLEAVGEDLIVIEREPARAGKEVGDQPPARVGRIRSRPRLRQIGTECEVRDADDTHPWIALRLTEGRELFEVDG